MISIITATYNRADLLSNLYKSLILQIDQEFEWIVIDDGSTDDTRRVLSNIAEQKALYTRWKSVEIGGQHRAVKMGV